MYILARGPKDHPDTKTQSSNKAVFMNWADKFQIFKEGHKNLLWRYLANITEVVYDWNHYFGLSPIPKPKPKLADAFGWYSNQYRNYILMGEFSYR